MSVRATLAAALASLAALALVSSGLLVLVTTGMHESATRLRGAAEAVELAEGAHLALVSFDALANELAEGGSPALRVALRGREEELRSRLSALRGRVASPEDARLLDEAVRDAETYLAARAAGLRPQRASAAHAAFEAARVQLEELVRLNLRVARDAERSAARQSRAAEGLAIGTGALALAAIAGLIAWILSRVLLPLGAIARAIAAYGRGDRSARAAAEGPAELRAFAATFNQMADGLDRQRELQLAFVAAVAHDLRNPLAALKVALARVRPDRPLPPEERIRHTVEVLGRQVARLERLLEDFLDASRIEAGRVALSVAECDLRDLAREAVELFEDASPRHAVELQAPSEPLRARCDPARVAQVLNNLLSNAIKYSPAGGNVVVSAAREGDLAVLAVSDEGIGVDLEDRERIFEPFRRGASARDLPGVGLGLSISRRIAEAHGGRIEVANRPGGGSLFRLCLPAVPPRSGGPASHPAGTPSADGEPVGP
ncbi:MAG TPA: HAMP domain-containing sensor histidine kinase [Anaeromyxobacteraceae bacterium]|nr:HAMP domain-containing sensor histidine kinase [Anaeromyxobacteraceae bacterium]